MRFFLSVDSNLDTDRIDAANDHQLFAVALSGKQLHASTEIGEVTIEQPTIYPLANRNGLVVELEVTLNVIRNVDLRYCGLTNFITQLDTHDVIDYDVSNNVIVNQVSADLLIEKFYLPGGTDRPAIIRRKQPLSH